ncbi:MAG TPA: sugar phosphate isomerase/epimerase family protein [Chloroflexota bacterium]|nr:sugar phosphate isomerase/epimerase family protein [Chloroflexota bacterium]
MRISFITANYVAREVGYALRPFSWGAADRATVEAFHGPRFAEKFNELCRLVREAGFTHIDLWVAHLNPFVATRTMVDEAAAILKSHGLTVVAYTAGLGRPDMSRAEAEKVYQTARAIGAPLLGVGLHPSNARLAYELGKEYGIRYAIENHPERTPGELLARIGEYGEVIGLTQDTGFWGMFGYDAVKATHELKDHLLHVHLKQVRQVGDEWRTCAYDEGVVDIAGVVNALREIGYQGAVSIEHEPHDEDPMPTVIRSARLLREWLA